MKLKDISTYEENGRFYMRLTYVYKDDKGNEHTRIYPKIDFPVDMSEDLPIMLPDFIHSSIFEARDPKVLYGEVFVHTGSVSVPANVDIVERVGPGPLKKPVPDISTDISRYNRFDDVYFADYISRPCIKEMTLEEIEKKLGYKVKVVSGKEETIEPRNIHGEREIGHLHRPKVDMSCILDVRGKSVTAVNTNAITVQDQMMIHVGHASYILTIRKRSDIYENRQKRIFGIYRFIKQTL